MQPYFIPYLGYFQLIHSVDIFVFYDDVNFIKNGWINRNRILLNGEAHYLTIPLQGASSYKPICRVGFLKDSKKNIKKVETAYSHAPFFNSVFPLILDILNYETDNIGELAIYSILSICKYLGISKIFHKSSIDYSSTKGLGRTERLIAICRSEKADCYHNLIGGKRLYSKDIFSKNNLDIRFICSNENEYSQFSHTFVPSLSIIDVLMFNSIEKINVMLQDYILE